MSGEALGQGTGTIAGTIVDSTSGAPLPGVNVVVEGTQQGAATGADGTYEITGVEPGTYALVATFVGYADQTREGIQVQAGQTTTVDFALQQEAAALEEMVVVGYGQQQRKDLTGSLSSVSAEDMADMEVTRPGEALQGKVAGLNITSSNQHPGGELRMRIRGHNSLQGSNNPLVVVDGVMGGSLQMINSSNIESVEVLKGPSATAIYGSRGANGVILVTTKKGGGGEPSVEASASYGMQRVRKKLDLLNAQQHAELIELAGNRTVPADPSSLGEGTDWQEEIFRPAPVQDYQIALSGGSGGTRYRVSGNYLDQEGVVKSSAYQRSGFRANVSQEIADQFDAGANFAYRRSTTDLVKTNEGYGTDGGPIVASALRFSPIVSVRTQDGTYGQPLYTDYRTDNPVATANLRESERTSNNVIGNVYAEYYILDELTFRADFGYNLNQETEQLYISRDLLAALNTGRGEVSEYSSTDMLLETTLTYDGTLGERHNLNVVGGFTAQEISSESSFAGSSSFPNDVLGYNNLSFGANPLPPGSGTSQERLMSFLGRVNYGYDNRYLVTVTSRMDGASKFAKNQKWAFFPSTALGWRVSEESFMEGVSGISNLKLRAGFGRTGSQAISPYQSLAAYDAGAAYTLGTTQYQNGVVPDRVANPDLKWETTTQYDLGLDLGLFGGRLSATADYYYKRTDDLLYQKTLPSYTGYQSQIQNIGSMRNEGVELSLNADIAQGDFSWSAAGNFSLNRNEVLDIGEEEDQFFLDGAGTPNGKGFDQTGIVRVGEPIGSFWGYTFAGIYQNQAEAEALPINGNVPDPGTVKYKDIDGDGEITDADKSIIGNPLPDYTFGLTNEFFYGNFDLSFSVYGVQGKDVLNINKYWLEWVGGPVNQSADVLNYWRGEGTSNTVQAPGRLPGDMSTRFIEDASYIRLQNLTLGYTLPAGLAGGTFENLRIYVNGSNLLTFTDYSGYDPAVNSAAGNGSGLTNENLDLGYDSGAYPGSRSYTIGINAAF
jgi:TonB-linked SusC/RagA family outer membrane protein